MAVYRDAKVEEERGAIILYPSKPPVSPRSVAIRSC
jgi:hypothetical protein